MITTMQSAKKENFFIQNRRESKTTNVHALPTYPFDYSSKVVLFLLFDTKTSIIIIRISIHQLLRLF